MVCLKRNAGETLPKNYDFSWERVSATILEMRPRFTALQFPDGLLRYSCAISKMVESVGTIPIVMLDPVYGACCIDDLSSHRIGCSLLLHYGHSCIVPVSRMRVKTLYVHVDVIFDVQHLINLISSNFCGKRIAIAGTVQFIKMIHRVFKHFDDADTRKLTGIDVVLPQIKPLSAGEILGCTSPSVDRIDLAVFVGDGRFHMEGFLLKNPTVSLYRYCPYDKRMTNERYDYDAVIAERNSQFVRAMKGENIGIVISGLGNQTNPRLLLNVVKKLLLMGKRSYIFKVNEIKGDVLEKFDFIDAFVQLGCPRLSIDWGSDFPKPVLAAYELFNNRPTMDSYEWKGSAEWKNYSDGAY